MSDADSRETVVNPYQSVNDPSVPPTRYRPRVLIISAVFAFGCAAICGLIGMILGAILGAFVPSYYETVFSAENSPGFNPVAVGVGLGLTQGVVFGGLAGVALVAAYYWYETRLAKLDSMRH